MTVRLHNVNIQIEPDSVANVNIMYEHHFKALLHRSNNKQTLGQCKSKLNTLRYCFITKGKLKTVIRNQTCGKEATFIVEKGRINTSPALIKNIFIKLVIGPVNASDGGLTGPNATEIMDEELQNIKSAFVRSLG